MSTYSNLSSAQLRRAADLKEKISALEQELEAVLGGAPGAINVAEAAPVVRRGPGRPKGRKMSPDGIARIKAAQKLRWAKYKAEAPAAKPARVKKFTMSPAAKAKIAAAQKARWAKVRAEKEA